MFASDRNKADLPPEILDRIFGHCEHRRRSRGPSFLPKSRLQPLMLVCKNWHGVAERRLYTSVSLGDDRVVRNRNGRRMEIFGRDVCKKFCETVEDNARIASLVRELRLKNGRACYVRSELHVRIIGSCKNVKKLVVHGWNTMFSDDLKAALTNANLLTLELWCRPREDGVKMLTSDVLRLLPSWPRLQSISAMLDNERNYEYSSGLVKLPSATGACPALRSISIFDDVVSAIQLAHLVDIAPRLEEIYMTVRTDCGAALQQCLRVWSSSLKSLTVHTPLYGEPFLEEGCPVICFPMAELRELRMPSPLLTTSTLHFLPNLETLFFPGGWYSEGFELARLIQNGGMPNLRFVDAYFLAPGRRDDTTPEVSEENMRVEYDIATELRRVCEERNIFVQPGDGYVHEDCLEGSPESSDNDWHDKGGL